MNVDEVVFLKSGSPKLMITWLVGITENPNNMNVNELILASNPHSKVGDICIKYYSNGKEEKNTFPKEALIDDVKNLIPAQNNILNVGNVVKHKLTDIELTITWIIGQPKTNNSIIDVNKLYKSQGFTDGDVLGYYFDKTKFQFVIYKASDVEKIYE